MIRVFTAFSGYDSQMMALRRAGIECDLVGWSEIERNAIKAHNAIFPEYSGRNFGDICNIDWNNVPDFDLFTYSSPCQDFSCAGRQAGGEKGSGTRSSLLWECENAIMIKCPKYLIFENVKDVVTRKFIRLFNEWQKTLRNLGYTNYAQILNAKDYGVPQNRERIFLVSILDADSIYNFPNTQKLEIRLKDVLEENVPKRYYLSETIINGFIKHAVKTSFPFRPRTPEDYACTITSRYHKMGAQDNYITDRDTIIQIGNFIKSAKFTNPTRGRIYSTDGVSPTITCMRGGNLEPKIIVKGNYMPSHHSCGRIIDTDGISATVMSNHGTVQAIIGPKCLNSKMNGKQPSLQNRVYDTDGISAAITTGYHPSIIQRPRGFNNDGEKTISPTIGGSSWQENNLLYDGLKIRKLTERECFRLMGVEESDIDKIQSANISKTKQYELAGNSIVVQVFCAIVKQLFAPDIPQTATQQYLL